MSYCDIYAYSQKWKRKWTFNFFKELLAVVGRLQSGLKRDFKMRLAAAE